MSTLDGLRTVAQFGIEPDVIYIDAEHSYRAVTSELELAYELFPTARLVGDDFDWRGVRDAVDNFTLPARAVASNATGPGAGRSSIGMRRTRVRSRRRRDRGRLCWCPTWGGSRPPANWGCVSSSWPESGSFAVRVARRSISRATR